MDRLGEITGWPHITFCRKRKIRSDALFIERERKKIITVLLYCPIGKCSAIIYILKLLYAKKTPDDSNGRHVWIEVTWPFIKSFVYFWCQGTCAGTCRGRVRRPAFPRYFLAVHSPNFFRKIIRIERLPEINGWPSSFIFAEGAGVRVYSSGWSEARKITASQIIPLPL